MTIGEEITKLVVAGFIKKVGIPDYIVNLVLVKKRNGEWMMCVDYMSLNIRHV